MFNFCLLLDEAAEFSSYIPVVLKVASLLQGLEEQNRWLSRDESECKGGGGGKVFALCEILLEDLNLYSETQIPIDEQNTLNLKLFPTYPPPPRLQPHNVPLSLVGLQKLVDPNWDLTMLRILPYIDGVNSLKQISLKSDADFRLTRKAVEHLVYYGCIILLDVFHFNAIYACTPSISDFVEDDAAQQECLEYIYEGPITQNGEEVPDPEQRLGPTTLVEHYLSLRQGLSVKVWYMDHAATLMGVDVRRLITFGVIRGFLYRVHKYALASRTRSGSRKNRLHLPKTEPASTSAATTAPTLPSGSWDANNHHPMISTTSNNNINHNNQAREDAPDPRKDTEPLRPLNPDEEKRLGRFLDGTHCFDEICTEMGFGERELMARLREWEGEVWVLHR